MEIYYTNGKFFHTGQTDLENPRQAHIGSHLYWTGTYVPFRVLKDLEHSYYSGGSITARILPAGVYRVLEDGNPAEPTTLERLGDDYTPAQKTERDNYWSRSAVIQ